MPTSYTSDGRMRFTHPGRSAAARGQTPLSISMTARTRHRACALGLGSLLVATRRNTETRPDVKGEPLQDERTEAFRAPQSHPGGRRVLAIYLSPGPVT